MSIRYLTQRYEPYGDLCGPPVTRELSPGKATVMLVRYELGYGGHITDIEPTRIVIQTSMMARYDITEFSGSEEEMKPLLLSVGTWYQGRQQHNERLTNQAVQTLVQSRLMKPLHVAMFATMFLGNGLVFPVLCTVAGLDPVQAVDLKTLAEQQADAQIAPGYRSSYLPSRDSLINDTIDAIIELMVEGASFEDCVAAAA